MPDITFIDKITAIPAAWLNQVNRLVNDIVASGDANKAGTLVPFDANLVYSGGLSRALRDNEWNLFWFPAVRSAVAAGTDCTAAVQAVIALRVAAGGGSLYAPRAPAGGAWLFSGGAASPDGYKNGALFPFSTVNFDPTTGLHLRGEKGCTWKVGADNVMLIRISRNNSSIQEIVLDSNGKSNVILCGIVPEDMTQTSTLVSQSFIDLVRVDMLGGAGVEGLVIQPGPRVLGADSGCFYHNIHGGVSNFVGGGRHVYLKKGATWATDGNRPTRTNFIGRRLLRGNAGYYLDVGSEINLIGCHEELIATGVTPVATPVARYISANCSNITFVAGYSEGCTKAVTAFASNIYSLGYIPASGSNLDWRGYASAFMDGTDDSASWTPGVNSSGGGAQGAATSTGRLTKYGKIVHFVAQISAAKGTLGAGSISISGLPFIADSSWTGADFQGVPVTKMDGITLGAGFVGLTSYVSGATISLRKMHGAGAGMSNLLVADCSDPIVFTVQGWFKAV